MIIKNLQMEKDFHELVEIWNDIDKLEESSMDDIRKARFRFDEISKYLGDLHRVQFEEKNEKLRYVSSIQEQVEKIKKYFPWIIVSLFGSVDTLVECAEEKLELYVQKLLYEGEKDGES